MNNISKYLSQYREDVPQWLRQYKPGDQVAFKDFFDGRVGYNPSVVQSGIVVKAVNEAHCVPSFLYVSSQMTRKEIGEMLQEFDGYHLIGHVEWSEKDMMPNGQHPFKISMNDRERKLWSNESILRTPEVEPFAFLEVLERDSDRNDNLGPERLAIAFLFANGTITFYQLFVKQYHKNPWMMILGDRPFPFEWDRQGQGSILDRIMTEYNNHPMLLLEVGWMLPSYEDCFSIIATSEVPYYDNQTLNLVLGAFEG